MENLILVTNWEKVEKDNFYLTDDWKENEDIESIRNSRELQKDGNLYLAYIVNATSYAVYTEMDADQVFINSDAEIMLRCESAIIDNNHKHREIYEE